GTLCSFDVAVWTKVPRAVVQNPPRDRYSWINFFDGDLDVGIALVVLQSDVVSRLVLLDENIFENQSLDRSLRENVICICYLVLEGKSDRVVEFRSKMRENPALDAGCLSHVDRRAF